jgi:hypothetical protein
MRSRPIGNGMTGNASQLDSARDDARGGSFLLAHQQLGVLALGTNPSNNQVVPIVINGTTITVTFVTSIGSTANNILIGASATASVTNLVNFLRRPDVSNSNQVAASSANQALLQYVGWAWPGSSTNIVPFSLNKNANENTGPLTSFNITGITVTSGTWTAQTMQLYVEDGTYYIGTTRVLFTGGSTPTVTAPVSHPRIDVLTADSSGTLAWTTGSENVSPTAPAYPAGKVPICELYNVVSETALYDNEDQQASQGYILNDVRPFSTPVYIGSTAQVASGLFILDPGGEVQGDLLYYNGAAWVRLAAGTSGQVLITNGASANPSWSTSPAADIITGSATGTNYTTTSTSLVDMDATNLKRTLSGLTVGDYLYVTVSGFGNAGAGGSTDTVQLTDVTNSASILQFNLSNSSASFSGSGWYKIPSTTVQFSLQFKTNSGTTSISNSNVGIALGGQLPFVQWQIIHTS